MTFLLLAKVFQISTYVTIMCCIDELSWLFTNRLDATR